MTLVNWFLRVGFLFSPLAVGFLADVWSLRVGLFSVVLAGIVVTALGRVLVNDEVSPTARAQ